MNITKCIKFIGVQMIQNIKRFVVEILKCSYIICKTLTQFCDRKAKNKKLMLRRRTIFPSMVLVIDLDETLILSKKLIDYTDSLGGVEVPVNSRYVKYQVERRPHVHYFLSQVHPLYEIVLYTASTREYAEAVIGHIDIDQFIDRRLCREECEWDAKRGCYVKNLKKVKNDISKVILIDDSLEAAAHYPENTIPISGWKSNKNDTELLDLLPFLIALRKVRNVRLILQLRLKTFRDFCQLFVKLHPHLLQNQTTQ